MSALEQAAAQLLPLDYNIDYAGEPRQLRLQGNSLEGVLLIASVGLCRAYANCGSSSRYFIRKCANTARRGRQPVYFFLWAVTLVQMMFGVSGINSLHDQILQDLVLLDEGTTDKVQIGITVSD